MNPSEQGQSAPVTRLAPRIIKGLQATFVPADWPGENTSGLRPYGDYVLVKMDEASLSSAGGVLLTDDVVEHMSEAAESGCIYAIGAQAFRAHGPDCPQVGDRVYIEKYAGIKARGKDGGLYRIMEDRCIAAGYDDAVDVVTIHYDREPPVVA